MTSSPPSPLVRALFSIGLEALLTLSHDGLLILLQRMLRMYAYGSSTLVLALLFSSLGLSDTQLGAFMTLTLLGDVLVSLLLTLVADRLGRRNILMAGAGLMLVSGVVFALSSSYAVLLLAAIVGVISPSGNEIGPFRAIEESIQAQITPSPLRADIFAISGMLGFLSAAAGQASIGWATERLIRAEWGELGAYRAVFWVYAGCAAGKLLLTLGMSEGCEVEKKEDYRPVEEDEIPLQEEDGLELPDTPEAETPLPPTPSKLKHPKPLSLFSRFTSLFPTLSPESRSIVWKLSLLFALDSLGGGLVPQSFVVYFFYQKFGLATSVLGMIFSITSVVSGISNLVAVAIAKQIGLVRTMVYTHLPSAIFLSLTPASSNLYIAAACIILRSSTSSMDRAPRTAFTAQVVLKEERTGVLGIVNVARTLAQAAGPWISGRLSETGHLWLSFVVAGGMKAVYDLGILAVFLNTKPREEGA
ncbi:MFS general substrate transporter [Dacryopinax primogenitus]|uniref:MFS general substrate transporter n=1 Tax=Dacryopinax primogenitus (strain DJM 731) TaxID=1858805 RepID=M5GE73_DACPD|nr:MFS general substrate transporter [Dacryopinax primogenitus]EJU03038.1 MFS general substrate transporter [Dacryopinax primogenitus]